MLRGTSYVLKYSETRNRLLLLKCAMWLPALSLAAYAIGGGFSHGVDIYEIGRLLIVMVVGGILSGSIFGLPGYLANRRFLAQTIIKIEEGRITIFDNASGKSARLAFQDIRQTDLSQIRLSSYNLIEIDVRNHGVLCLSSSMQNFNAFVKDLKGRSPFRMRMPYFKVWGSKDSHWY